MQIVRSPGARLRTALSLLLAAAATVARAQYPAYPAGTAVQQAVQLPPRNNDPAELLAQALRTLAVEPGNLPALTAAGRNALVLGDPNAAVGFLGRASEIAPRDGQVKAGLGAALVQLEKPQEALRLFGEASALGVPDADLAADRGLAYDLTGDPGRAQRDYQTALAAHPEADDVRRSLALSQGISGDKAAAIATLDPLIRKRDIAGWRAQTFVLAMTGDARGAGDITHIMLPTQAAMLQPFLQRLSSLSAADKAKAVHFGEMPSSGRAYTPTELANTGTPATYASAPAPVNHAASATTRFAVAPPSDLASMRTPPPRTVAATPRSATAPAPATAAPFVQANTPALTDAQIAAQLYAASPTPVRAPTQTPAAVRETPAAPLAGIALGATETVPQAPRIAVTVAPVQLARAEPPAVPMPSPAPAVAPPLSIATTPLPASHSPASPATLIAPAATASAGVIPMPGGTPGGVGHFDLPHDTADRVPVARTPIVKPPIDKAVIEKAPIDKAVDEKPEAQKPLAEKVAAGMPVTEKRVAIDTPEPMAEPRRPEQPVKPRETETKPATIKAASDSEDARPRSESARAKPAAERDEHRTRAPAKHVDDAHDSGDGGAGKAKSGTKRHGETADTDATADDGNTSARSRSARNKAFDRAEPDTDTGNAKSRAKGRGHVGPADGSDGDSGVSNGKGRDTRTRERDGKSSARSSAASDDRDDSAGKRGKASSKSSGSSKNEDAADSSDTSTRSSAGTSSKTGGKASTERVYVQVAGGANKDDLDKAWRGVKKKAPDLMKGHTPSTVPLRATNRLLVGPFKDEDEAQAFVNKMAAKGLSGFTFKNAKGQKIDKIDSDR